ncbi:MAG TPA: queuosine precursor transporter [Kofleriaceae bacterium]
MKLDARLNLFITLVAVFITCLIVGDIIGGKLTSFELFGREWVFSVGQLAFPVTFILTDILNEFYGRKVVRRVTFLALAMVALTFGFIYLADTLSWAPFTTQPGWDGVSPKEFHVVFTQATDIQLASMLAFLIGNLTDISVFFLIKKLTGNRMLWLRATGSTAVSQLIDTIVISAIIWGDRVPFEMYVTIVMTSYLIKLTAAIVVTPIIYALHELIEKKFGIPPAPADVASADITGGDPPPKATARER